MHFLVKEKWIHMGLIIIFKVKIYSILANLKKTIQTLSPKCKLAKKRSLSFTLTNVRYNQSLNSKP